MPNHNKPQTLCICACRWVNARKTWFQCVSNGVTSFLHLPIDFTYNQQADYKANIDGLVQKRRNSTADALQLRISCTKPPICYRSLCACWCNNVVTVHDDQARQTSRSNRSHHESEIGWHNDKNCGIRQNSSKGKGLYICKHAFTGQNRADAGSIGPVLGLLRRVMACLLGLLYLPWINSHWVIYSAKMYYGDVTWALWRHR